MALLTVTEAARLARRSRASIYRDLEKGRLEKVFTADGALKIDSADLARCYGAIGAPEGGPGASPRATHNAIHAVLRQVQDTPPEPAAGAALEVAQLRAQLAAAEQRMALLERIARLEKSARQAADASWRVRLEAKEEVVKALTLALSNDSRWPTWHRTADEKSLALN